MIKINGVNKLRNAFWNSHEHLEYHPGRRQNAYPAETRQAWVEFVDAMEREGLITAKLADKAIL